MNLTVAQVAIALGISRVRVRVLLAAGRIPGAAKHGRDWLVPEVGLDAVRVRLPGRKKAENKCANATAMVVR